MDNLVLDGGHMPDAADMEDIGSEIYSMVVRYESTKPIAARFDTMRDTMPPKQVIYVLYGILFIAVAGLITLWSVMF